MLDLLAAAVAMGFVGSLHCVGMCGPLVASCGGRGGVVSWQVGKWTTYALLGALAGTFGAVLPVPPVVVTLMAATVLVGFGASALGWLPEPKAIPGLLEVGASVARGTGTPARLAFGALSGLLPCGLVYAALGLALASEGPLGGAVVMTAFALGTAPALTAIGLAVTPLTTRPRARRALAVVSMVAGLWVLAHRAGLNPLSLI